MLIRVVDPSCPSLWTVDNLSEKLLSDFWKIKYVDISNFAYIDANISIFHAEIHGECVRTLG